MTDEDAAQINEAKEKLMKDSQALFGKMYEQAQAAQQAAGGQAGAGDPNASYNSDDVVDADYKEV